MSSRKILFITYYFPPLGGAGIGRPLALFQNLSAHNFECQVLTVKPVLYRAYEPDLCQGLDNTRIFRSGSADPSRLLYLLGVRKVSAKTADDSRLVSKKFFPDSKAGWIRSAIRMGKKLIKSNNYDLILSSSPPISAHVIAKELSQEAGIPWVADFRDFWTSINAEEYFGSDAKRKKAKELLDEIIISAKSIVAVNESVAAYVGAKSVISNCYDAELAKRWRKPRIKDKFTIGVFGTVSDLTPIEPLLKVLHLVKQNRPDIYSHLHVLQVGHIETELLKKKASEFGLDIIFYFNGYQAREKAVELLSEAAMFYIGTSLEHGFGLTTNRIFTLLSSGRPILAFSRLGSELDRINLQYSSSFRFDESSFAEAGNYLSQNAQKYLNGDLSIDIEPLSARKYSSDKMVEKFAALFNQVLAEK